MNVRSVAKHMAELKVMMDVFGVTETLILPSAYLPDLEIPNYRLVQQPRGDAKKTGGGVAFHVHTIVYRKEEKTTSLEYLFIRCVCQMVCDDLYCGVVYRTPLSIYLHECVELIAIMEKIASTKLKLCMMGDFNINMLEELTIRHEYLKIFCTKYELKLLNLGAMRGEAALDLFLVSCPDIVHGMKVMNGVADHKSIQLVLRLAQQQLATTADAVELPLTQPLVVVNKQTRTGKPVHQTLLYKVPVDRSKQIALASITKYEVEETFVSAEADLHGIDVGSTLKIFSFWNHLNGADFLEAVFIRNINAANGQKLYCIGCQAYKKDGMEQYGQANRHKLIYIPCIHVGCVKEFSEVESMWTHYFTTHILHNDDGETQRIVCQVCLNRNLKFEYPKHNSVYEKHVRHCASFHSLIQT